MFWYKVNVGNTWYKTTRPAMDWFGAHEAPCWGCEEVPGVVPADQFIYFGATIQDT